MMGRIKRNPNLVIMEKITPTEELRRQAVELWWRNGHVTSFVNRRDATQTWDVIKLHPDLLFNLNWYEFDFERGIIEGPNALHKFLASGHNPHALLPIDVETHDGWRLLTTEEVSNATFEKSPYRVEAWLPSSRTWDKSRTYCGDDPTFTYRTKAPLNGAKLKATRKITPKDWENHPVIWVKYPNDRICYAVNRIGCISFGVSIKGNREDQFEFGSEQLSRLEWSPDRKNWYSFTVDA